MVRMSILSVVLLACLPMTGFAATSTSSFRVGITIARECRVAHAPDGAAAVALHCDGDAASSTAVHTIASGDAWPRAREKVAGEPRRLQEVDAEDGTPMIVVEY